MKNLLVLTVSGVVAILIGSAAAAPAVNVLGLPLGGKLPHQLKKCRDAETLTGKPASICWAGQPSSHKGAKSGMVLIPGADSRPKWAAYAMFDLALSSAGEVERIKVRTHSASLAPEIIQSISSRFGTPNTVPSRVKNATWVRPELTVEMLCSTEWCSVDFTSAANYAARQDELAKRKKIDEARPIAP